MTAAVLELQPYQLRLRAPLRTARGVIATREGLVVLVRQDGLTGRGEAAPLPWLGTETVPQCEQALRETPPTFAGLDQLLRTPSARCGLEQALLDLRAQREGVPLCRLLHPAAPFAVPCSALLSAGPLDELVEEARRAVAEGFATLKLKVGQPDDLARATAVRAAVGPGTRLRLDANGAWDDQTALLWLRALAPLDVELCEQPSATLQGLRGATPVRVAADELLLTDPEAALDRADVLVLKPMLLGGLLPALELARRARARGLLAFATTSLEGAIGRAGAAHLAAALLGDGPQPDAGLATGRLLERDLCPDPLAPVHGSVQLSPRPGLGLW